MYRTIYYTFPRDDEANVEIEADAERQFTMKSATEKFAVGDVDAPLSRGNSKNFKPSSVCLAKMVPDLDGSKLH
ncbi:unnamed protein product [Arabis nemorensis]|uniref:Uncharacterized protein n=1 Tax=Arabis nemorensis TaxID=586526 RepID=A0A565CQF0_9BRAS|nr:unnamed protein product [Arabis nemorensis]